MNKTETKIIDGKKVIVPILTEEQKKERLQRFKDRIKKLREDKNKEKN